MYIVNYSYIGGSVYNIKYLHNRNSIDILSGGNGSNQHAYVFSSHLILFHEFMYIRTFNIYINIVWLYIRTTFTHRRSNNK